MTCDRRHVVLAGCALTMILVAAGCSPKPASVIEAWPVANSERSVASPPVRALWPLTGLVAPSPAATERRVMSVKIENLPAARPQTGLNSADVVYESVVEGGITRFNLLFQSTIPKVVGPVRSARLSDVWIVPQYHAVFFYSGSSSLVGSRLRRAKLNKLPQGTAPAPYFRTSRPAPHNLYMSMSQAWAEVKKHHMKTKAITPKFKFGSASTFESATAVKSVYIPLSSFNNVTWTYSKKRDVFLRQNNHVAHRDGATGKQVVADNVIVVWAKYTQAGMDKHGGMTWDIDLGGTGRATVFRNGSAYNCKWVASRTDPPQFVDRNGQPVRLTPGNSWIEVVPLDVNITMK
jgi:hypothetical protein